MGGGHDSESAVILRNRAIIVSRLVLVPLILMGLPPLHAQAVTGALEGRVLTETGAIVEGAAISVEGPALQGTRATTTDERGRFSQRSLPAGPYLVRIRRIGYGPVRLQSVPVHLGATTSVGDISLDPEAVELTEIVVAGARPVIDPVSAATGASIQSSQFLALPAERSFRALLPFVAQANTSDYSQYGDGVNIGGSTGLDNAFYIDGMHATVAGGSSIDLPFNFVREIQVLTGGYEAEYGRSLSGVVNVVTPSGGNEFQAQVLGFFTSDAFRTAPRVGLGQSEASGLSQYDAGLSLSGPLRRDGLWYSVAYNPTFAVQDASLAALAEQRDRRVHHLFAGKLTWKVDRRTDLSLTLLGDPSAQDWVRGSLDVLPSTVAPSVSLGSFTDGGTTAAVHVRHDIDASTLLNVSVSRLDRHKYFGPRSRTTASASLARLDDFTTNVSSGGFGYSEDADESRTGARVSLTLPRGLHTVKLGAEYEANTFSSNLVFSLVSRLDENTYEWVEQRSMGRVRNKVPTLYAQDAWEVSRRFRVNAGLRWESQYLSGDAGPSRTIGSELSPRVGIVYQPGHLGSQRLFASAGRFYEQVRPLGQIVWNGAGSQLIRTFPRNPLVDSTDGVVQALLDFSAVPATADLRGQHYDQFTLGYERRLGESFKIGAHGTYRTLRWALEDGVAPGDSVYRMGNPGRGPLAAMERAKHRYVSLTLSIERSVQGPLYLLASYVLSRNAGNYTGLFASEFQGPAPNSGPQYDVPDPASVSYGLLPNDRTHVGKVAASYRTRFGVTLGGFLTVASGTPVSEQATSESGFPYLTFVRARGSAGRTPAVWSLDLHTGYDLPWSFGTRVRPRVLVDVFNVGSPRKIQLYEQRHYLDAAGEVPNPNFGAVTHYQAPMSARVGMALTF